jgi:hypothetical protein
MIALVAMAVAAAVRAMKIVVVAPTISPLVVTAQLQPAVMVARVAVTVVAVVLKSLVELVVRMEVSEWGLMDLLQPAVATLVELVLVVAATMVDQEDKIGLAAEVADQAILAEQVYPVL